MEAFELSAISLKSGLRAPLAEQLFNIFVSSLSGFAYPF